MLDSIVGVDTPIAECRSRAANRLGIPGVLVNAALAERSDYVQEDDELIAE